MAFCSWFEPRTTAQRLNCVINLPSGVGPKDYILYVEKGGKGLIFKCKWPKEITDVDILHRKWLLAKNEEERLSPSHPSLGGFDNFFKDLRSRANEGIQAECRINLPFEVETHVVSRNNIQWKNATTCAVYVQFRAPAEEFAVMDDKESDFETV